MYSPLKPSLLIGLTLTSVCGFCQSDLTYANPPAQPNSATAALSPAEQFKKIVEESRKAHEDAEAAWKKAKSDEEKKELGRSLARRSEAILQEALQLTRAHPDDPVALDAHIWMVKNFNLRPEVDECLRVVHEKHLESEKLGQLFQWFGFIWANSKQVEPLLRDALTKSPHHSVRGQACFSLAKHLKEKVDDARGGKPPGDAEVEALFQRVVTEFADLPNDDPNTHEVDAKGTLAEAAQPYLFELRNLAVGKVAPEIKGEDIDGKKFELSDYRGKVVVIDFWGDW